MTPQEVKKVFRSYIPAREGLESVMETARGAAEKLASLRAIVMSGLPHSKSKHDPVADAVCRLQKEYEKLERAAKRYAEIMEEFERLVCLADDEEGGVIIRLRWQQGIAFEKITQKIHLEHTAMYSHYNRAVEEISQKA